MRCIASLGDLQIFKKRKKEKKFPSLPNWMCTTLWLNLLLLPSGFFRSLLLKLWVLLTLILDYFLKERFKTRRDNFCFKKRKKGKLKWIPTFLHCQEKRQHSNFFTDKQFWCLLLLLSPLSFKTGLWNMICAVTPPLLFPIWCICRFSYFSSNRGSHSFSLFLIFTFLFG